MDTDTLGRRTRTKRQSTRKIVRAMPRDLLWLEKLHYHGPLPTSYLHEFTCHLAKDRARTLKRLAMLHHEVNLLTRPTKQFDTMDARYNQLVYDLSDSAIQVCAMKNAIALIRLPTVGHGNTVSWSHALRHQLIWRLAARIFDTSTNMKSSINWVCRCACLSQSEMIGWVVMSNMI